MHHLPIVIVLIVASSIAVFVTLGTFAHKDGGKHEKCGEEVKTLMNCCALPPKDDSAGSKCEHSGDDHDAHCKFIDCLFKEKGYMNEAGEVDKDKFMKGTEELFKDHPEFMQVAKESVEKALEDAHKRKKHEHKEGKCNRTAMHIAFHSMNHILRNCPASKWTNSQQCNDLKVSDACGKKD